MSRMMTHLDADMSFRPIPGIFLREYLSYAPLVAIQARHHDTRKTVLPEINHHQEVQDNDGYRKRRDKPKTAEV